MKLQPFLPKLLYFIFFFATGLINPFYSVLLADLFGGRSLVGWTMGLFQLTALLMGPVWGLVVDVTGRPRLVLSLLVIGGFGLRAFSLFFLPRIPLLIAASFVASEAVFCGAIPILDALCVSLLGVGDEFGHQRLWGAVSWGVAAPLSGVLFERVSPRWGLFMAWGALWTLVAALYFAPATVQTRRDGPRMPFAAALRATRLRWQQVCFLVAAVFAGFFSSSISTFFFLHLEDLNGSSLLMGMCVAMMIVSEVPFMYFSKRISSSLGYFTCVLMGLSAYTVRHFSYQLLSERSVWAVLAIEPLHGLTFGIFYSACVSYVASGISTEETRSTWQGVFSGLMGLGRAVGSIGGGYLFELGGGVLLFRVCAGVMLCASLLFGVVVATDRGKIKEGGEIEKKNLAIELDNVFSGDEDVFGEDDDFRIDDN